MYKDSLGNSYSKLPGKPPVHTAKSSRGGLRKYGRNRTHNNGPVRMREDWRSKVHTRERIHRDRGQIFQSYPC